MNERPFVSVIIPAYNDERGIQLTLASLQRQDYPTDRWEIIVVDNNSSDQTKAKAILFQDSIGMLTVVTEEKQSSYAARNKGIDFAKGDILAFIDSDMTVGSDWISRGVADISHEQADYVGCRVDIYTNGSPPSISEIYNQRTGFRIKDYMEQSGFAGAGNLFVKRDVIKKLGPFDARLVSGGDKEFGRRVKNAGLKMYYSDHNVMRHPARSSLRSLLKKNMRIAMGSVDLKYYYPERYGALKLKPILGLFRPRVLTDDTFRDLGAKAKFQIAVIRYVLFYALGVGQLVRYVQIRREKRRTGGG
jgi:glycosyltransferase involved in cell wall biosynthesis